MPQLVAHAKDLKPSEALRALNELLDHRAEGPLSAFMNDLHDFTVEVVESHDLDRIVLQRERVGRLVRGIANRDSRLAGIVTGRLLAMDHALERGRTFELGVSAAHARTTEAEGVRGRVLRFVREHGVIRPRQITTELDLDAAQVSRALAQLAANHQIQRVEPPRDGDRRAHWYSASAN